jgi:spore maturation protein CgeB
MKILFIGPNQGTSKFNYQTIKKIYKNTNLLDIEKIKINKIQDYIFHHLNSKIFNYKIDNFYEKKIKKKYDIIFINNVSYITENSINKFKQYSNKIFYFCGDNPFVNRDKLRWENFKKISHQLDVVIFHIKKREIYAKKYKIKNFLLTIPPYYKKVHLNKVNIKKKRNIVFIGTWFPERGKFFYELKKLGMDFHIYGSRWHKDRKYYKYLKNNIKYPLKYENTAKIISKYKINLGLLSSGNDDDITRRCIEIPATGSLLCCQRTSTLKKIFKENKEALFFKNPKECFVKCKDILQKPKILKKITFNGNIKIRKTLNAEAQNIFKKIFDTRFRLKNNKKFVFKY